MNNKPLDDACAPANTWHPRSEEWQLMSSYEPEQGCHRHTSVLNVPEGRDMYDSYQGCILLVSTKFNGQLTETLVYLPGIAAAQNKQGVLALLEIETY